MTRQSFVVLAWAACAAGPTLAQSPPPNVVGMTIQGARAVLAKHGWVPRETTARFAGDGTLEKQFGDAKRLRSAGLIEIESCTGTGMNYCVFNYESAGRCMRLTTSGERALKVIRQTSDCPSP